ncbi:hypothetical protein GOP47_0011827 [Adiantum capillus-veneris]|uniref:SNRNP25 ubiquitin-like domain-containing protein n=1 Tax=Adiantum capillus-veneris TaxID=13818 RepID=A0A9D4UTW7_ADICA|nr:hypothetical protein GOP47_0011827 [Adiantum capillus-veneris]
MVLPHPTLLAARLRCMGSSGSGSVREYNKAARLEPILATLLEDPILADVPKNATLADIETLISVELGSAMKLSVLKMDNTVIDVAIPNNARVRDLKKVVEKKVSGLEEVVMGHRHISWRHVWKNYSLCYLNQKLLDDLIPVQDYGIRNNCQVQFQARIAKGWKHSSTYVFTFGPNSAKDCGVDVLQSARMQACIFLSSYRTYNHNVFKMKEEILLVV